MLTSVSTREAIYVAGDWTAPSSWIDVVNPATEVTFAQAPLAGAADVDRAVTAARAVADSGSWAALGVEERVSRLDRVLRCLTPKLADAAVLVTQEMGAPITLSESHSVTLLPLLWSFAADLARAFPTEELRHAGPDVLVRHEPVGVVAAIAPWNAPFLQAVYKTIYPLLAGCPVILKPAPETPLDSHLLADAMCEAEIPAGVISILPGGADIGDGLVRHPGIDKVSFTGSTAAGRRIAQICGERLKRTTLELGGKSAAIVLDDADLDAATSGLVWGALNNSGQVCAATSRVLVSKRLKDELVDRLRAGVEDLVVGDPLERSTQLGPLVALRQRDRVEDYIRLARESGARLVAGGGRPAHLSKGWYVEPTIFVGVDNSSRVAQEEIFGPVITVTSFDDDAEGVRLANESIYGLHGAVYTSDPHRARQVVAGVRTGTMSVNGFFANMNAPMGGMKCSGIGRKFGTEGFRSFLELKSVYNPGLLLGTE